MTLKDSLNRANPNSLSDHFRSLGLGDVIRQSLKTDLYHKVPAVDAAQLSTVQQIGLASDARASVVNRAYARVGTVTGELTPAAYGATPSTGQIAVAPNGDIVVLGTDAITLVDVEYMPVKGDVVVLTAVPVASNSAALPKSVTDLGALVLIDANVTKGTTTGRKIVLVPASSNPATTKANLDVAKTHVLFASADAVTECTLTLLVTPAKDVNALLAGDTTTV